tara:strand:+ start:95 stop:778 length:684 start_codon:yes stop_codon:yes gene_type:complete
MGFLVNSFIEFPPSDFDPNSISGLGAWYDASDNSTITESSSRVSQWDDKKGTANLVQATGGSQPLLVTADQNGLDIINFTGSRNMVTASLSAIAQPQTWYIVATAPLATGTTARIIDSGSQQMFHSAVSNRFSIYAGTQLNFVQSLGTTQYYIWTLRYNGASSDLLLDDVSKVTGNAGTSSAGTLDVAGRYGDYANNKFGEILRYDSDVSSGDDDLIIEYLEDKWGL